MRLRADDGGGGSSPVFLLTPQVILTLAAIALVLLLIVAIIVWRIYRRVRRSGVLERGLLMARSQGLPAGPGREIAQLRRDLRAGIASTELMISRSGTSGPASDLGLILGGLTSAAQAIDTDLHAMERDPDPGQQRAGLALFRPQVQRLIEAASQTRLALTQTAAVEQEAQLQAVSAQVLAQTQALEAYRQAYRELGGGRA